MYFLYNSEAIVTILKFVSFVNRSFVLVSRERHYVDRRQTLQHACDPNMVLYMSDWFFFFNFLPAGCPKPSRKACVFDFVNSCHEGGMEGG